MSPTNRAGLVFGKPGPSTDQVYSLVLLTTGVSVFYLSEGEWAVSLGGQRWWQPAGLLALRAGRGGILAIRKCLWAGNCAARALPLATAVGFASSSGRAVLGLYPVASRKIWKARLLTSRGRAGMAKSLHGAA